MTIADTDSATIDGSASAAVTTGPSTAGSTLPTTSTTSMTTSDPSTTAEVTSDTGTTGTTGTTSDGTTTDSATTDSATTSTASTTDGSTGGTTGIPDPVCGNAILEDGEACDAGPDNGPNAACKDDCTENLCGDGDLGPGEACDDGNVIDGDGCNGDCTLASCGNLKLDPGEQCDDGKDGDNTDACTDSCLLPACGDGFVQAMEQCDLGAQNSDAGACTSVCKAAKCGDGLVWTGMEVCDDGNLIDGDTCTNLCKLPPDTDCDGAFGPGEYCFANTGLDVATSGPRSAVVADFNGDGKLDFITADPVPKTVHVRVGNGMGGFDAGANFAIPDGLPSALATADIDADTDADIMVISPAGVTVMTNTGNAKFINNGPALAGSGAPLAIVAADIDGDGDPDFATADGLGNKLSIRWGTVGATFSAPTTLKAMYEVTDIAAVDMQGDGKLDLVALNKQSGTVSVYLNQGARKFARQRTYRVPVGASIMEIADINGDGNPDLLVVDSAAKSLYVRKGTAQGTFQDPAYHVRLGVIATELAVADVNGDGDLDVIAVHASAVAVATGDGTGKFSGVVSFPASASPVHVAVGDINGDGRRDLAVSDTVKKLVKVLWSDPDASSPACQGICQAAGCGDGVVSPQSEACDDGNAVDADGCRNNCSFPALVGCGNLIVEQDEVCFSATRLTHSQNWSIYTSMIAPGDLDGDGTTDLALAMTDDVDGLINNGQTWGEVLETWVGTGEGGFEQVQAGVLSTCQDSPRVGMLADYDKDGKLDLILNCMGEKLAPSSFLINVQLGNGNGTLQASLPKKSWSNIGWSTIVDYDKDGDLDIVMIDRVAAPDNGADFRIYYNKGVGVWGNLIDNGGPVQANWPDFDAGGSISRVHVADFNNDGFNDILGTFGEVWLIPGAAMNKFGAPIKANFTSLGGHVADFNKDGTLDYANFTSLNATMRANLRVGDGFGLFGALGPAVDTGMDVGFSFDDVHGGGDVDGDGFPDFVAANTKSQFAVAAADGNFSFKWAKKFGGIGTMKALHVRELSGDSRPEVLIGGLNQTMIYRSNP